MRKAIVLAAFIFCGIAHAAQPTCAKPWVFLDLGNTVVDTTQGLGKINFMPGAQEYLIKLRQLKHPMGMLINMPDKLKDPNGSGEVIDYQNNVPGKREAMKALVKKGWQGAPVNWNTFWPLHFADRLFLPASDAQRKPAPELFTLAYSLAWQAGCPAFYMGEVEEEMRAAKKAGLIPFRVGHWDGTNFYLAPEKFADYIENGVWKDFE